MIVTLPSSIKEFSDNINPNDYLIIKKKHAYLFLTLNATIIITLILLVVNGEECTCLGEYNDPCFKGGQDNKNFLRNKRAEFDKKSRNIELLDRNTVEKIDNKLMDPYKFQEYSIDEVMDATSFKNMKFNELIQDSIVWFYSALKDNVHENSYWNNQSLNICEYLLKQIYEKYGQSWNCGMQVVNTTNQCFISSDSYYPKKSRLYFNFYDGFQVNMEYAPRNF